MLDFMQRRWEINNDLLILVTLLTVKDPVRAPNLSKPFDFDGGRLLIEDNLIKCEPVHPRWDLPSIKAVRLRINLNLEKINGKSFSNPSR